MNRPIYTVFTPTYNRAHTLSRVYESLQNQTSRDFEWVVVDDGSADGTAALIKTWQAESEFEIVYVYQPNSGKHVAYNRGVQMARGELFLAIDSDDGFLPQSLESMLKWWVAIPDRERQGFTGIVTLCQFDDGSICGDRFPASPFDTNALELNFKHRIRGEKWGFHRTEVLKQYPFPEDPSVRFVPENLVWDGIARKFRIRCINEPLRIFYQDSGNQVTRSNPRRKALVKEYFLEFLNRDFDYFVFDPVTFSKWATLYVRYSLHLRDWTFLMPKRFDHVGSFLLCCAAVLPGSAFYLLDVARSGR